MATHTLPTYFISHGGGPWPWMRAQQGGMYDSLTASLKAVPAQVGVKPKAVLVISGHWETPGFTVMTTPKPPMLYDYSGFPPNTYSVRYPAAGSPETAARVVELLKAANIPVGTDSQRGYDHGTFVPLHEIYPDADVPVLQLSIKQNYDPEEHLALGRALAPLRNEGVLIIASGLSYHNLRELGPRGGDASQVFDRWLDDTLVKQTPAEREARLIAWDRAPAARRAHPQEDHLVPLMVAVGAAENDRATRVYHEEKLFGGTAVSSYMFKAA
jgi:aromatic ring-opening dioxygenase catalytic subunit (LigB family)